jgi:hypothetical protein
MPQPIDIKTKIDLPDNNAKVTITLVQRGAVPLAYGVGLLLGSDKIRDVVSWPEDDPNRAYALDTALTLRGLSTDCFGRVFLGATDKVRLWCEFHIEGNGVKKSDVAEIQLSPAEPSREFHIRCLFV